MTYALRGSCSLAAYALAALLVLIIALMALTALELYGDPFHEPFHGISTSCGCGEDRLRLA